MIVRMIVEIVCDGCGAAVPIDGAAHARDARLEAARVFGWRAGPPWEAWKDGYWEGGHGTQDLCPSCSDIWRGVQLGGGDALVPWDVRYAGQRRLEQAS